jgi:hypothetical protein
MGAADTQRERPSPSGARVFCGCGRTRARTERVINPTLNMLFQTENFLDRTPNPQPTSDRRQGKALFHFFVLQICRSGRQYDGLF